MKATAILLALCLLAAAKQSSEDNNNNDNNNNNEDQKSDHWSLRRHLQLEYGSDRISFESTIKNSSAHTKDKIEFELKSEGDSPMRFKFDYKHSASDASSRLAVRVVYQAIVEFVESSSSFNGFDSADSVVQRIDFLPNNWKNIAAPTEEAIATGGTKYTFDVEYKTGVFAMTLFFADAPFGQGGWSYTAGQVKVDITIENFPYLRNDTYLALVCVVKANDKIDRHEHDGDQEGTDMVSASDTAFAFGWNRTVVADSVLADVVATDIAFGNANGVHSGSEDSGSDEEAQEMKHKKQTYYAFNAKNAKQIVWDPVLGVQSGAATIVTSLLAIATALVMLL